MAKQIGLTDEQVEAEIVRLRETEAVRLALAEQRLKYRRRQYLYTLRQMEKRGKTLMAQGYEITDYEEANVDEAD